MIPILVFGILGKVGLQLEIQDLTKMDLFIIALCTGHARMIALSFRLKVCLSSSHIMILNKYHTSCCRNFCQSMGFH